MQKRIAPRVCVSVAVAVTVVFAWFCGASPVAGADVGASSRPPNIVVILADDLGYADLGCQGAKDIRTPNVDSLAKSGIRFTNGYVSCPVCSPTRAGLMTGRYQQRFGHEFNPGPNPAPNFGLPVTEATLAERLRKAGYATGIMGKWHLGFDPPRQPLQRGFDEFFGFLAGAHGYLETGEGRNSIRRANEDANLSGYLTDALGRESVAFIDRHKDQPFFLYLPFNAIHTPMQATEKYEQRFASIADKKRRTMAGMLSALDDNVGLVLKKLADEKLDERTLIFFLSDNGGPTAGNGSRNDPLRGFKGQVLEGGIRIPFIVRWKGQLPAGKVCDEPVISLDIHPTCLAVAGYKGEIPKDKPLDGVNLLPYLRGEKTGAPHDVLYWRFGPQAAIRRGAYKLVRMKEGDGLYDLANDVGEAKDLSKARPEILRKLAEAYEKWDAQLMAPAWQTSPRPGAARRQANRRANRQNQGE